MPTLKDRLYSKILKWRPRKEKLLKKYGDVVIDEVKISNVMGGMRGLMCLISDVSYLDPEEGIRYRGYLLKDLMKKLPRPKDGEIPYVEGLIYLLLTGDIPNENHVADVIQDLNRRRILPKYIYDTIDAFPNQCHPMAIFSSAILAMQQESFFNQKYRAGIPKQDFWDPTYEDAMNLIAKLPEIASYIYSKLYKDGKNILDRSRTDFGQHFANLMGIDKPYDDVSRMHFIIHADHESGNVSAHTGHLVASTLSDIYLSVSGMLNGLAGSLHGMANQEVLIWLQDLIRKMDGKIPTEADVEQYVWDTLNVGNLVPGYGHAVLRKTDPRYEIQREFSLKHLADDPIFKYVDILYKVVPRVLKEHGKAKNPWPNVDAHSGAIQYHYGVKEYDFYTVLFGVGRTIGVASNIIWDRALMYPIERPKSVTMDMLEQIIKEKNTN